MKKTLVCILLAPMLAFGQDTLSVSAEQRQFCLNVIQSIVEHNCEDYVESISDSVVLYYTIRDTLMAKSDLQSQLMMLCYVSVKNDTLTFQYYLDNFEMKFYDVHEVAERVRHSRGDVESTLATLNYYHIQEGDIFFQGAYHKTRNRLDFILDDAFKFVFRKINGEYKIIVITP